MIIRPAKGSDARAITAIWNQEIIEGVSTFNSQEKSVSSVCDAILSRPNAFLVAESDGVVAGFATYSQFRAGVGYAHSVEHTVYLAAEYRGQGGGRALMAGLEKVAKEAGVHVVVAGIGGENLSGIAFHKALGFVETGRMPQTGRKFDRWMDLVLMQKIL
ncbi:phosphinothricin acetyltransferase [Shimia gijangensis]|uniref:Phosphinothricin acetyltransferase n=1 Tax=Shimia gijangensis TaxID=1470563 RepID=A0A1M6NZQ6_9RHOB|nr:GNAT family N-acetyltransferase [Shimia gijangensis]SHK01219.1 phosphinothricin acetyltransferase [Shimia gijangensis]